MLISYVIVCQLQPSIHCLPPTPAHQVEVIALALARPPPAPWPAPPTCSWPAAGRTGGGMLVVTPPAILQQWVNELRRHSGLTVEVYEGLKWHRQQVRGGWQTGWTD